MFFVFAGIFIGIVVFGNTIARKKTNAVPEKQTPPNIARAVDPIQGAIGEPTPIPIEAPAEKTPTTAALTDTSTNLTANLASLIGKNIVDKNPEGPVGDNLTVMGVDGIADAAAEESMKHFNPAYFSPDVLQSELTIDEAQTTTAYRAAAAKIAMETESQPPPADAATKDRMTTYAKNYAAATKALYALAVPLASVPEHTKAIRIALGKERILKAVADYENDPIYAMLALKLWDTLK